MNHFFLAPGRKNQSSSFKGILILINWEYLINMKSEKRETILKGGSTATTSSPPYTPAGLKFAISV